jgi:hypothetical protein
MSINSSSGSRRPFTPDDTMLPGVKTARQNSRPRVGLDGAHARDGVVAPPVLHAYASSKPFPPTNTIRWPSNRVVGWLRASGDRGPGADRLGLARYRAPGGLTQFTCGAHRSLIQSEHHRFVLSNGAENGMRRLGRAGECVGVRRRGGRQSRDWLNVVVELERSGRVRAKPALNGPATAPRPRMASGPTDDAAGTAQVAAAKAQVAAVKSVGRGTAGGFTTSYTLSWCEATVNKSVDAEAWVHLDGSFNVIRGCGDSGGLPSAWAVTSAAERLKRARSGVWRVLGGGALRARGQPQALRSPLGFRRGLRSRSESCARFRRNRNSCRRDGSRQAVRCRAVQCSARRRLCGRATPDRMAQPIQQLSNRGSRAAREATDAGKRRSVRRAKLALVGGASWSSREMAPRLGISLTAADKRCDTGALSQTSTREIEW